jgi:hypothetical protein
MRHAVMGCLGAACFFSTACNGTTGPGTGPQVTVRATQPTFTIPLEADGRGRGQLEVEVTNLSSVPLFVFSACGNPLYKVQKNIQTAWLEVELAGGCLMGATATPIQANQSGVYSLKLYSAGPLDGGTFRVDFYGLSRVSDMDEFMDGIPLPASDRLSDAFEIVVEADGEAGR